MRDWIDLIESQGSGLDTILYHGSNRQIDKFEAGHSNGWSTPRSGFYFCDDPEVIKEFFGEPQAFQVRLQNVANFENGQGYQIIQMVLQNSPPLRNDLEAVRERYGSEYEETLLVNRLAAMGKLQGPAFITTLRDLGYDGMMFDDLMSRTPFTSYVVFDSGSISPAT